MFLKETLVKFPVCVQYLKNWFLLQIGMETDFLNTLITHKSGITHLHQVRTGSGKTPSLPSHQNSGSLIFPTGWKVIYLNTIILSLLAAIARNQCKSRKTIWQMRRVPYNNKLYLAFLKTIENWFNSLCMYLRNRKKK